METLYFSKMTRFYVLVVILGLTTCSVIHQGNADVTCFPGSSSSIYHCVTRNKDGILRQLPRALLNAHTIYLNNSAIRNIDDTELHDLVSVKKLYLNDNYISKLSTQWFSKLKELLLIDLARNYIVTVPANIFRYCPKIQLINFSGNKIEKFKDTSDYFANTIVDFSYNPLIDFEIGKVHTLYLNYTTLEKLHLKERVVNIIAPHSSISNFSLLEHADSSWLQTLILRENNLTDIKNISALAYGPSYLDLSQNYFGTLGPDAFLGLSRLIHLNLSQTVMLNLYYGMFWNQTQLKVLDMSNNHLWSFNTQKLYPAPIQELYIQNNTIYKISDSGRMLHNLRKLGIAANSLPCEVLLDIYREALINGVQLYTPENLKHYENNNIAGMACTDPN